MIVLLLTCSHLAAVLVGAYACRRLTLRYGGVAAAALAAALSEDGDMDDDDRAHRYRSKLSVVVLVAAAIVIVIGAQAAIDTRRSHHEQACAKAWADDVTSTLRTSRAVNQQLRDRDEHWHKRVDSIFQLLIASRHNPDIPDSTIDHVVTDYQRAKSRLFEAYTATTVSNVDNPLPTLDLDCDLSKPSSPTSPATSGAGS